MIKKMNSVGFVVISFLLIKLINIAVPFGTVNKYGFILIQDGILLILASVLNHYYFKQKILVSIAHIRSGLIMIWPAYLFITGAFFNLNNVNKFALGGIFLVAILAAITEEYISRGIWLSIFFKSDKPTESIIISSLLFGLMHLIGINIGNWQEILAQSIQMIMFGILLGVIYLRTKNIIFTFLMHFSLDLMSLLIKGGQDTGQLSGATINALLTIGFMYLTLGVLYYKVFDPNTNLKND